MSLQLPSLVLVEDHPAVLATLTDFLVAMEVSVVPIASATEALLWFRENEVGVAILDVRLGSTMDGVDVAVELRRLQPHARLIFLTAFSIDSEIQDKVRRFHLDDCLFLSKPISPDTLLTVIQEAFDGYISDCAVAHPTQEGAIGLIQLDKIDLDLYLALNNKPELLQALDWRQFERLLADILETLEYEVELQKGTKDRGIDIIAVKKSTEWGDHRYLLQAKRWTNRVGIEPVQRLLFLQDHLAATKACLATTSTFTRGAWRLAHDYRWQLELRDYNGLRAWIETALRRKIRTGA